MACGCVGGTSFNSTRWPGGARVRGSVQITLNAAHTLPTSESMNNQWTADQFIFKVQYRASRSKVIDRLIFSKVLMHWTVFTHRPLQLWCEGYGNRETRRSKNSQDIFTCIVYRRQLLGGRHRRRGSRGNAGRRAEHGRDRPGNEKLVHPSGGNTAEQTSLGLGITAPVIVDVTDWPTCRIDEVAALMQ